jgi:Tfp pilus assembly protein PilF
MIVTAVLYSPVRHHPFVNYDDGVYVTDNYHVKYGLHRDTFKWAFKWAMTSYDAANWHPLTWLSHMLDYRLFGDRAGGHHDVNLLLHVVNVGLLFWVLRWATGRPWPSLMVAALFALHPINTETVVWIAERKNLLSMTFLLLTLGAWTWYAQRPRWYRYLAAAFLFALALMAKPQVITLPFVLLLWDYWPLQRMFGGGRHTASGDAERAPARSLGWLLLEKVPLLALSAGSAILTVKAQRQGGGFNPDYTLLLRMENAAVSYARYIGKAFWPSHLAPMYPHPGNSLPAWQACLAVLILVAISAVVLRLRQQRYLLVGWLWFLGTLVPMIGLVQVGRQAMADRYAYLPFIGLFIMVCWGVADGSAVAMRTRPDHQRRGLSPAWMAILACSVLLLLVAVTHQQIGYWRDDIALWTHTAQVTSGNYEAEDNLGEALLAADQPDEAYRHFLRAAAIYPTYPRTLMFLAVHDQRDGKLREAIAQYNQVIAETQNAVYQNATIRTVAFTNLGHAYRDLGELEHAKESLESALALKSDDFSAWLDLGLVSQRMGNLPDAIHAYFEAVRVHPSDIGYLLLSQALEQSGHTIETQWAEQKAKDITSDYARAQELAKRMLAQ